MIFFKKIYLNTKGAKPALYPITHDVVYAIKESAAKEGLVSIVISGLNAGLFIAPSYEGFEDKFFKLFDQIQGKGEFLQSRKKEQHELYPLISQSIIGSTLSFPFSDVGLLLSADRDVVVAEFSSSARRIEIIIQVLSVEAPQQPQAYGEYEGG